MRTGDLTRALRDLIRGNGVRRATHDLRIDDTDASDLFLKLLESEGYSCIPVQDVPVSPGERVPAFHIQDGCAHFGWVFWEVFSADRKRKLFGSQAKNAKGDWAIILARTARVHVCIRRKEQMDTDRPSSF